MAILSFLCLLVVVSISTRVLLLFDTQDKFTTWNSQSLSQFIIETTGQNIQVDSLKQLFPGDLAEAENFAPNIVVDFSISSLSLNINSKAFVQSALFFYNDACLKPAYPSAKAFRESPVVWVGNAKLLASHFGISEAILIVDASTLVCLSNSLKEFPFTVLSVGDSVSASNISNLVSRTVRISGIKSIFIMGSDYLASLVLGVLSEYEMDAGYAVFLIGSNCQFDTSTYSTGVICVALAGSESALSEEEADYWYLLYGLQAKPLDSFTVVNLIEGQKVTIGLISQGSLSISPIVVFPRGLLTPPDSSPIQVSVNLNNWSTDRQRACMLAYDDFKLSTEKFEINVLKLDECGIFDPVTGYLNCYISVKTNKVSMLLAASETIPEVSAVMFMSATGLTKIYCRAAQHERRLK